MQPEIRERPAFWVLGVPATLDPLTADWPTLWATKFGPRMPEIAPFASEPNGYGMFFCDTGHERLVDFLAAMVVPAETVAPPGLTLRAAPAAREAVFQTTLAELGPTWLRVFQEWLPGSTYDWDQSAPCYERYAVGAGQPDSAVTIHVAVRPR